MDYMMDSFCLNTLFEAVEWIGVCSISRHCGCIIGAGTRQEL